MRRFFSILVMLTAGSALASCSTPTATPAGATATKPQTAESVDIRWFVGLGLEAGPEQRAALQSAADEFNRTVGQEKNIRLLLEVVYQGLAQDTLAARIDTGDGPDIVGPSGLAAAGAFHDQWLNLNPIIMTTGFDTSVFTRAMLEYYTSDDALTALPFAVNPSVVFYNVSLFNRSGYSYPPDSYHKAYFMPDGTETAWTWDTLAALARLMTVDGSGRNTADPDFSPKDIRQYGFTWEESNHPNYWGSYWSGGTMWDQDSKTAMTPEAWADAWQWTYDAIWSDPPFLAESSVENSPAFGSGKPFSAGKAAMTVQPFNRVPEPAGSWGWDIGVLPSYKDGISGRVEESAFRILKSSPHPQEAFTVLQYLTTTAVASLLVGDKESPAAFSAVPALISAQEDWKAAREAVMPWVYNLDAVLEGINYPDTPSVEGYAPNYREAWLRGAEFAQRLRTAPGLDLAIEIKAYEDALTAIFTKPDNS
ncbi:MAG: extracellular solute-binding protein [Anaerolineales bacterium]|nr:extracellular solute-binding protein [Anaerolineales bacterium]